MPTSPKCYSRAVTTTKSAALSTFLLSNEDFRPLLADENLQRTYGDFVADVVGKLGRYGSLSEAQVNGVRKCVARTQAFAAQRAVQDADTSPRPQTAGVYRNESGVYRVVKSKQSGNLYAKKLNLANGGFDYVSGAIYRLRESDRLTLDQARAIGQETGVCIVCGAFLTDPKSVAAGIGPVCAKRV